RTTAGEDPIRTRAAVQRVGTAGRWIGGKAADAGELGPQQCVVVGDAGDRPGTRYQGRVGVAIERVAACASHHDVAVRAAEEYVGIVAADQPVVSSATHEKFGAAGRYGGHRLAAADRFVERDATSSIDPIVARSALRDVGAEAAF